MRGAPERGSDADANLRFALWCVVALLAALLGTLWLFPGT